MSPTVSSRVNGPDPRVPQIIERLLGFLWRQWAQLGVSGDAAFADRWLLDPEALLLFTLSLGRYDPRLFDEVLDWCVMNGEWVSIQRLKSLIKRFGAEPVGEKKPVIEEPKDKLLLRIMSAVAATLHDNAGAARWRTLQGAYEGLGFEDGEPVPFFRELTGDPLPLFGEADPNFLATGLLRPKVILRHLSMPPLLDTPASLILKLRALFGLDPRAEALSYLFSHPMAGAREVARATGYAPSTVHTVLSRLSSGKFLLQSDQGGYGVEGERWRAFLGDLSRRAPVWIDWAGVFSVLVTTLDALTECSTTALSPYLRASLSLRLGAGLRRALVGRGLPNAFAVSARLDNAEDNVLEGLLRLAHFLEEGVTEVGTE